MNALEWLFGLLQYGQCGRERRRIPRAEREDPGFTYRSGEGKEVVNPDGSLTLHLEKPRTEE